MDTRLPTSSSFDNFSQRPNKYLKVKIGASPFTFEANLVEGMIG